MNVLLLVLLALFGVAGGFFLGCGNYGGLLGAILPGLIGGAVLAIPMLRERQWLGAGIIVVCALVGSLIASQVPDDNGLKQYLREQRGLVIRLGSYRIGGGQ